MLKIMLKKCILDRFFLRWKAIRYVWTWSWFTPLESKILIFLEFVVHYFITPIVIILVEGYCLIGLINSVSINVQLR